MTELIYINDLRIVRRGTPYASTEIDLGNGKAIQIPGTGKHVEAKLRKMKEARG
jgi:hypothetical protein